MKKAPLLFAPLALLAGCITAAPASGAGGPTSRDGLTYARLRQTVNVGGPRVTPLAVIEDSRCPARVTCVWAGRVRISARIATGRGSETRELTLGQAVHVADGSLVFATVAPAKGIKPNDPRGYRFGLRFMGGI